MYLRTYLSKYTFSYHFIKASVTCLSVPTLVSLAPVFSFIRVVTTLYCKCWLIHLISLTRQGFPGGSDGKELACNAGYLSSCPELRRAPGEGHGKPLQYSCLENAHGQRTLTGYSSRGHNWVSKHNLWDWELGKQRYIWKGSWAEMRVYTCADGGSREAKLEE